MSKRSQKRSAKWAHWSEQIEEWRTSELSAAAFCLQKGIGYASFLYWRKRLTAQALDKSSSSAVSSFIELREQPPSQNQADSGVSISYHGVQIQVTPTFDRAVFLECLKLVKEGLCCH